MESIFVDGIIAIILSIIIYKAISGFLYDVTLRRLAKPSFTTGWADMADLFFAYCIGMISFLFINSYIKDIYSSLCKTDGILTTLASKEPMIIIGLTMLYIGRIITKKQGVFYGRLHFSAIFITSSILLVIDFVSNGLISVGPVTSNFNIYSPSALYCSGMNTTINYVGYLLDGDSLSSKYIILALIGSLTLAIPGELYLVYKHSNSKSALSAIEKLPTEFIVISDEKKMKNAVEYMFKGEIVRIKCASRSLNNIGLLKEPIEKQFKANQKNDNKFELDYRILVAPEKMAEEDYFKFINSLPFSIMNKLIPKEKLREKFKQGYQERLKILENLEGAGMIVSKPYYYKDMKYLITITDKNAKKILVISRDRSTVNGRIGLYSDQVHIVNFYEQQFDHIWDKL